MIEETTGDLIGNKIANKITKSKKLHYKILMRQFKLKQEDLKNDISPEKKTENH